MNDKTEDRPDEGIPTASDTAAAGGAEDPAGSDQTVGESPEPADQQAGSPMPVKKSSASGILALLIALAAAAGTGYVWYELQAQAPRVAELGRELDRRSAELDRMLDRVEDLTRIDRDFDDDLAALTARVDAELDGLPERLARLETTLEKVPGISEKTRSAWLRSEAEYFLRVANAQLNLAGNVDVSLRALELADEQLRELADPALTPVREAISDERAALRSVPRPDAEGIVLALGSLSRSLDTLRLAETAPGSYRGARQPAATESGWRRAWRAILDALKSVISVKREDQEIAPLMTAAEEALLVRSLDVDLQIARLAVIRNEGELYRRSLEAVRQRLRAYFDTASPRVAAALATIDEVGRAELPQELPDISASLSLLRNATGGDLAP